MPRNQLEPDLSVTMFLNASDEFSGSFITQDPTVDMRGSVAITDMAYKPLGLLLGRLGVRRSDGKL